MTMHGGSGDDDNDYGNGPAGFDAPAGRQLGAARATTAAHTRSIIDCHLLPQLGHRPVAAVTTAEIDEFYTRLLTGGGAGHRELVPSTVRRIHGVLHRALTQALQWGWIWINPAAAASPPRVRRTEIRPPTPGQVATLLTAVRDDQPLLFCFLRLAATTGSRRSQLLALRWRDVDLRRGTVAFTRALVVGPDGPVLAATKTDRTHQVDLDVETLEVVRATRVCAAGRAAAAGVNLSADAFVFTHDANGHRPWPPDYATRQFIAARRDAGLPHFRLHDLRHFMATQMLASNVPIATVARRLNHARISTTVDVYTHAIPAWDRPAAETLARALSDATVEAG